MAAEQQIHRAMLCTYYLVLFVLTEVENESLLLSSVFFRVPDVSLTNSNQLVRCVFLVAAPCKCRLANGRDLRRHAQNNISVSATSPSELSFRPHIIPN